MGNQQFIHESISKSNKVRLVTSDYTSKRKKTTKTAKLYLYICAMRVRGMKKHNNIFGCCCTVRSIYEKYFFYTIHGCYKFLLIH